MSLENDLHRIANALEIIAKWEATPGQAKAEKASAQATEPGSSQVSPPPAGEAISATLDDVRNALIAVDRDTAKAILAEYDARTLKDLDPDAYPNIIRSAAERRSAA